GATSKVVVLRASDIARIRSKSASASSSMSPWKSDEAAMWLKSTIRQLQKWVPTSTEYRDLVAPKPQPIPPATMSVPDLGSAPEPIEPNGGVLDEDDGVATDELGDDIADAVLLDSDGNEIDDDGNIIGQAAPAQDPPAAPKPPSTATDDGTPTTLSQAQSRKLHAVMRERGYVGPSRFPILSTLLERDVDTTGT